MESPDTCLTNVLKIDGFSHIRYHVYVPTNRRPNPGHGISASAFSTSRSNSIALRHGEKYIKEIGILGVTDLRSGELWVFDTKISISNGLSVGINNARTQGEVEGCRNRTQQGTQQDLASWGLRISREGIFQPHSVRKTGKSILEDVPPGSSSSNSNNLFSGDVLPSSEQPHSPSLQSDPYSVIYKNFIVSILAILTYSISKSSAGGRRYIPLNFNTLIQIQENYTPISASPTNSDFSLPTPPPSTRMHGSDRGEGHERGALLMFSLTAYLTSSGTLCIIPTGKISPGLDSMSSLIGSINSTLEGRDVWIAPWGRVGRVRELITSNSKAPAGMKREESQWATEVRQYLVERGIWLSSDEEQWARVDVWLDEDEGSERLLTIVWPVSLCFIRLSERDNHSLLHRKQEVQSQVESVSFKLSGQGTPISTGDFPNHERPCEQTTFSRNISANYEWVTLGGLVSSPHGGALPLQDPGVIWFSSSALDPVEFSDKWKMGAEQRLEVIKSRREKEETEKQKTLEAESLKLQAEFLHKDQEEKERELKGGVIDIKREAASTMGSVSGVYSTPPDPDGQVPASISTTEVLQEIVPPDPSSAVSLDASTLPLTLDNDIDIDWSGTGDPMSLGGNGNAVGKSSTTDGLASIAAYLGDDLVEGDDDIFAAEVTDKDFDFFDEPGFADPLDNGIGLTETVHEAMGATTNMIGHGADGNIISMAIDSSHSNSLQNIDFGNIHTIGMSMDIHSTTPMISKMDFSSSTPLGPLNNIAQPIDDDTTPVKHVQTPPLSPQRAMKLLLPQYAKHWSFCNAQPDPPQLTIPNNENASNPAWNCDDLNNPTPRRPSIYSPLTFLPGIEMVDKKYMEGGRFFGLPPKEEKLEFLDGKLASISLLDTPNQRSSNKRTQSSAVTRNPSEMVNRPQPTEPTIEEIHTGEDDRDSDESEYGYNENESSESDVDEESDLEYSLPPLLDSSPVFTTGHKRKRAVDDDGDLALTESEYGTGVIPILQVDKSDSGETTTATELAPPPWQSMAPDPEDYCLVDIFEMSSTDHSTHHDFWSLGRMSDAEYHSVSKIVAHQIATGSPFHRRVYHGVGDFMFEEDTGNENLEKRRKLSGERRVEEIIKEVLDGAVRCTLEAYAAIPDAPVEAATLGKTGFRPIAQPRRGKQLAAPSESSPLTGDLYSSTVTFKIPPPHVHVHRAETVLEISPVALKFWETFGFGPCSGPKNIIGFCIFPAGDAMVDAVDDFMERVGATYDSCRLGSYVRGNIEDITGGMMGVQLPLRQTGELELGLIMQSIRDTCMRLGSMLTSVADEQQNIVIYLVNPFSKASLIPDLCYAFSQLNHAYSTAISQLHNAVRNHVVLQIVPIDFIIVKNGLVAAPQTEYIRFALEVYNRCMPTDNASSVEEVSSVAQSPLWSREKAQQSYEQKEIYSPSIILAKPVPKAITFQFSAEPVNPLLQGGSCIHVAYRQSLDERWAVFAWTDNYGEIQFFETYCLGRKGCTGLRLWEEVARDVWKKTVECIRKRNMTPRVCLTKVEGWVNTDELDLWVSLATESTQQHTPNTQSGPLSQSSNIMRNNGINLTILIADTTPALSLIPTLPAISPQSFNPHSSLFTPVSTPDANMLSPGLSGTSAINTNTGSGTPSADAIPELDPDAQLIDYADEVWAVILSHKFPISPVMVDPRSSLVSGYLIKRGAHGVEGGEEPVVMGVSLVGGNCSPGPAASGGQARKQALEAQLKEVMWQWRGLLILAQHKGVIEERGGARSVLPWHVAVVHKVVAGFEGCGI